LFDGVFRAAGAASADKCYQNIARLGYLPVTGIVSFGGLPTCGATIELREEYLGGNIQYIGGLYCPSVNTFAAARDNGIGARKIAEYEIGY